MARNRLIEINSSLPVSFFDGTIAHSAVAIACEHTVLAIDYRSNKVAVLIDIPDTLLFNHFLSGRKKVVPNERQNFFQLSIFLFRDRRAGIALYATFAKAFRQIAAKETLYGIKANQHITNLQHNRFFFN